jgi:hypothetical protein
VDPGDGSEIAVEEPGKPGGVVDGASARAAGDEELEARQGERVLHVDEQEPYRGPVRGSGGDLVPFAKLDGVARAALIGNAVDLAHFSGIEMLGER